MQPGGKIYLHKWGSQPGELYENNITYATGNFSITSGVMIRYCLQLIVVVGLLGLLSGCGDPPVDRDKTLVVGMELNYRPFEYFDEQGKPVGVGVEMAEALAELVQRGELTASGARRVLAAAEAKDKTRQGVS